jgi:hypothetical protein
MSSLLDVLKKVVTPKNVNCIPSDVTLDRDNFCFNRCKELRYGFMEFALVFNNMGCVEWLISNFISYIDFERIMLPDNTVCFVYDRTSYNGPFSSLLEWCAKNALFLIPLFLKAGVRVGNEKKVFDYIATRETFGVSIRGILEPILQLGYGTKGPMPKHKWSHGVYELVYDYRCRRRVCKKVVIQLLGLLRFKKTRYFSGLDPRLLKQMVVTPVWETRYSECWNTTENKKIKNIIF